MILGISSFLVLILLVGIAAAPAPRGDSERLDASAHPLGFGGVQRTLPEFESAHMKVWEPDQLTRLRATQERLRSSKTPEWQELDLVVYLREYKRRKASTISTRLRQLRFMERHDKMPVRMHGERDEIVNSFWLYVKYREDVEGVPMSSLVNDHKAIRVLGDFLGIPHNVWPTAPMLPRNEELEIPSPEMVHDLLHADYLPNVKGNYANALLKYLLVFDFGFGIRFPSEPQAAKLQDVDLKRHILTVTEPKKSGRRRRLLIEPEWLCCGKRHASLANWLTWREKCDPKTDALFPRPDGQAFESKEAMSRFIWKHVGPRFDWFNPYLGRHWSVNARLVEWDFDYARVADWHGHESVNMTKNHYAHSARLHERLYGDNWLRRAFEKPRPRTGRPPKMNRSVQTEA